MGTRRSGSRDPRLWTPGVQEAGTQSQTKPSTAKPGQVELNQAKPHQHPNQSKPTHGHQAFRKPGPRPAGHHGLIPHSLSAKHGHQAFRKPGPRHPCHHASGLSLRDHAVWPTQLSPWQIRSFWHASAPGKKDYKGRPERKHQGIRASHHGFVPQPQRAEAAMG